MKETGICVKHRGNEIWYNEGTDRWEVRVEGGEIIGDYETLSRAKVRVDALMNKERAFKRIAALKSDYRFGFTKVTITSICEPEESRHGSPHRYAWIINASGKREKTGVEGLRPETEKNLEVVSRVKKVESEIKALEEKARELISVMEPLTLE